MANVTKWSKVGIAMQSALATSETITAITKADPAVVSIAGHSYVNGDYVVINSQGMGQVHGRVFRVSGVAAGTFELEGEDSSLFDDFSTGDAAKITFGTTLGTVTGVSGSGGDFDFIDTTTIHDNAKKQIPGAASALSYQFENIWDVADAALIAMKKASDNQTQSAFLFTFPNGYKMAFNGYVGASLTPGGSAQDKVVTTVTITAFGAPTYYAT